MKVANFNIIKIKKNKNHASKNSIFLKNKKNYSQQFTEQIANTLAIKLLDASTTKKSFDRWVCLTIPAKTANLLPPIGPFLGQHGFNTLTFCNNFNNLTKNYPENLPLKTTIKLFSDKTLVFQLKTPPTSFLLYSASSKNTNFNVSYLDILKIALIKKIDLSDLTLLALYTNTLGTAWSMKLGIH